MARPCRGSAAGAPKPLRTREPRNPDGARRGAPGPFEGWARDHLASWEVWPLRQGYRGKTIQTGWTVELLARCPRLREGTDVAERLLSIAREVLARDTAGVASCALPYDGSLRIGPDAAGTPEVRVTIEVTRRANGSEPSDGVAREAVHEIELQLRALGLRKRH